MVAERHSLAPLGWGKTEMLWMWKLMKTWSAGCGCGERAWGEWQCELCPCSGSLSWQLCLPRALSDTLGWVHLIIPMLHMFSSCSSLRLFALCFNCLLSSLGVCLVTPSFVASGTDQAHREAPLAQSSNGCADLSVPSCMAHCRLMHPGSGGVICQSLFPLALHLPSLSCFQFHVPEETGLEMRMKYGFPS